MRRLQGRRASRVPGRGLRPNSQAGKPQRVPERRLSPMGHPRPVGGVPGNSMWRRSLHPDTGGQLCSRRRVSGKDPVLLRDTANRGSAMSSGDMPSPSPSPMRRTRQSTFCILQRTGNRAILRSLWKPLCQDLLL